MKRIIAVGDPHARISTLPSIIDLSSKIAALAVSENATAIVVLGDLFNDFARIHLLCQRAITIFFETLLSSGKQVFYVVGNHDMMNNQVFLEDYHALTPFRNWKGLTIADRPMAASEFVFCPYVAPGRLQEALDSVPELPAREGVAAIFCHQEIRGAKMGAVASIHGDEWPEDFPLIVTGHIHDHAWLQKNVLLVGTPMSQAYGESDDKTVSILDFEGTKLLGERRVDLGMPKRITVELTVEQAKTYQPPENTLVRVNLKGTTEEIAAFKKSSEYASLVKIAKVVPKHVDKAVVRVAGEKKRYLDLLKRACESESLAVQAAFEELTQPGKKPNAA